MPRGIAIETSGRIGSIATVLDGRVLDEQQFPHGLQHAAHIVSIIDRMCSAQSWSPRDVAELYVSVGPGSFTGLRIGITLAKTMALATGVKIVAVPTVHVLAENAPAESRHLIIVLDAKRDQIFTARFERGDERDEETKRRRDEVGASRTSSLPLDWHEREPAHLDDLRSMLARSPRPVHLLGEGIPYHEKFIPTADAGVIVTPAEMWCARAAAVARIGVAMAQAGQYADPLKLVPIYIRRPEAEEKFVAEETKRRRDEETK